MKNICTLLMVLAGYATTYAQQCVWAKGGVCDNNTQLAATVSDAAGNVYSMGSYSDSVRFGSTLLTTGSIINTNTFVVKYNSSGTLLWAKQFGDSLATYAASMAIDGAGNLYLFGNFEGNTVTFGATTLTNHNGSDFFLLKLDGSSGNVIWVKGARCGPGFSSYNYPVGVAVAGSSVVVTGVFDSTVTFGSTSLTDTNYIQWADVFVARYDTAGNVIWATNPSCGYGSDKSYCVAVDASGNSYVTGYFAGANISFGSGVTAPGPGGMFLVKYNAAGTALWAVSAGDTCSIATTDPAVYGARVATDAAGNIYVFGSSDCPAITFGSTTLSNTAPGDAYLFLVKYNPSGSVVWAKGAGGDNPNAPLALLISSSGSIYVGGMTYCTTLSFGSGVSVSTIYGGMFLAKYNSAGTAEWARSATGVNSASVFGIAQGPGSSVYAAGIYNAAIFTLDTCVLYDAYSPYISVFTAKFNDLTSGIAEENEETPFINIYPNPATTQLTIQSNNESIKEVTITNLLGQTVHQSSIRYPASSIQMDVADLPSGVYFIKINGTEARKFTKE